MNAALLLGLFARRSDPVTTTYFANTTVVIPPSVSQVNVTGRGGNGQNAYSVLVQQYDYVLTIYKQKKTGGFDTQPGGSGTGASGPKPADYCEAPVPVTDPVYDSYTNCYTFTDSSYYDNYPATTGANSTGFGKTFAGATGNVTAPSTTYNNVAVTPGGSYPLVIPAGGAIQVSYFL